MTIKKGICRFCGKEFKQPIYNVIEGPYKVQGTRTGNLVYCSEDCMKKWEKQTYSKRICQYCGKEFNVEKTDYKHYSRARFCSSDCQTNYTKEHTKYYCQYCYKELDGYKDVKDRYCSEQCKKMRHSQFNRICVNCNKTFDLIKNENGKYPYSQRFCCVSCEQEFNQKRKSNLEKKVYCQFCGKEITGNYNCGEKLKNKYCSEACVQAAIEKEKSEFSKKKICKYCGKSFIINERTSIGDLKRDQFCSSLCRYNYRSQKYKEIWKNKTPEQMQQYQLKREQTNRERYNTPYTCLINNNNSKGAISDINREFAKELENQEIFVDYEFYLNEKSYDMLVKGTNTLVEINPTYTHSVLPTHWDLQAGRNQGKPVNYHLDRTVNAQNNGYRCIHIWQWDNKEKIVNLIKPKTKIYARKLQLKEITKQNANKFLDKYHLQNSCYGNSVNLGLYQNEELIQVMTFGKPRYNKNYQWELLRLCTKSEYYVVGGAERLFRHFIKTQNPESVISYCDISKFTGDVYKRLGFKLVNQTKPQKIWSSHTKYITDNLLRQRGADQLIGTHDGKGTDNEEIMIREGWRPVYDCGQKVFVWLGQKFKLGTMDVENKEELCNE